jgi:hypothetical protein
MTASSRILVVSTGGAVSSQLARALHDAGHDARIAGADDPALARELDGGTQVVLDLGGSDISWLVPSLVAARVSSVVVLSDAVVELAAEYDVFGYGATEAAIRACGLAYTILRPTDLSLNALRWADQFRRGTTVAAPYLAGYQEPVHELDVVDAAVAVLTDDRHRGHAYRIGGPHSLTRRELIEILARAADRPVDAVEQLPEVWQAAAEAAGIPSSAALARLATWRATVGRPGRVDATITAITGATPRTFAEWARAHRAEFAADFPIEFCRHRDGDVRWPGLSTRCFLSGSIPP